MYYNRIKEVRAAKGMTMSRLAMLSGLSVGYICHLEKGTRKNPSIETMEKIAKVLDKSILELFFK